MLSLDIDPKSLKVDLWPELPDIYRPQVKRLPPWFSKASFGGPAGFAAYEDRLAIVLDAVETPSCFTVRPTGAANPNEWLISLPEFCDWALNTSLSIPEELRAIASPMTTTSNADQPMLVLPDELVEDVTVAEVAPVDLDWKKHAREIGIALSREKPQLSLDQIAKRVHAEMLKKHDEGMPGMTGRGNNIPSADTIRRHALIGIKSR